MGIVMTSRNSRKSFEIIIVEATTHKHTQHTHTDTVTDLVADKTFLIRLKARRSKYSKLCACVYSYLMGYKFNVLHIDGAPPFFFF